MAKVIQIIVLLIVLNLLPSISYSVPPEFPVCQSYNASCVFSCCLSGTSGIYTNYGCLIGEVDAYIWIYAYAPDAQYCENHSCHWSEFPPCGKVAPFCNQSTCLENKLWALCAMESTCTNPNDYNLIGNDCKVCSQYNVPPGCQNYGTFLGSCTDTVYVGQGCSVTYTYCSYEPIGEPPEGGCSLVCPPNKIPDENCINCVCPVTAQCEADKEFNQEQCICACKNIDYEASGNMNVTYDCKEKTLNIVPDIPFSNYLEVYLELYKCHGSGGGGGDLSQLLCSKAYAQECSGGWDYLMSSYDGLWSGINNLNLETGEYRLVIVFYRSGGCWLEGTQKYTEKYFSVGCGCNLTFNTDKMNEMIDVLKVKYPFSVLGWIQNFFYLDVQRPDSITFNIPLSEDFNIPLVIESSWYPYELVRFFMFASLYLSIALYLVGKIL